MTSWPICVVNCTGYVDTPIDVADPMDCHKYYICTSADTYFEEPFSCPLGENFDRETRSCQPKADVVCNFDCEACTFDCATHIFGNAANPSHCSVYYECDDAGTISKVLECGTGSYYDGFSCQSDMSRCCTCKPPACAAADYTKVADLADCHGYYVCFAVRIPDERAHDVCDNKVFNPVLGECEAGAACVEPCATIKIPH